MEEQETADRPAMERAIVRAIEAMRDNIGEPLTIDDMARTAMYSKFHFSREFQRVTGVSPRRFLSALRIQEAKRLLISTAMTVTEISHRVGYTSVGTFSSRFASSVGVSPTAYRQLGGFTTQIRMQDRGGSPGARPAKVLGEIRGPRADDPGFVLQDRGGSPGVRSATVRGEARGPHVDELGLIFLGLFPSRIPQGRPVRCTVLERPGPFVLEEVPVGTWYLLGHSVPASSHEVLGSDQELSVGSVGPIEVRPDTPVPAVDFRFRAFRTLDPPVLLALLDVRSAAFREGFVRVGA